MLDKFADIRPYLNVEIPDAMKRIVDNPVFETLSRFNYPDTPMDVVRKMVLKISSADEFQQKVMYPFNKLIIKNSMKQFDYKGIEYISPDKTYLFISNHRDIVLDSSLFQQILLENGIKTTEITFGSNLMRPQFVVDIGKSNKMFKVERDSNIRKFIEKSRILSEYIRYTIMTKEESVWIAQRGGRTKDGFDLTEPGIIKMFCMSDTSDLVRSIDNLNIVPIAVSYQIESCDFLKTRELYLSMNGQKYVKQKDEDLNSIITGMTQQKGEVNVNICKPIHSSELNMENKTPNECFKDVASLIDKRIYENYTLYNYNYVAYDMLAGKERFADYYTEEDKSYFVSRCEEMLKQVDGDKEILTRIFTGIYANPVKNKLKLENHD
jgi:hypothetical protein